MRRFFRQAEATPVLPAYLRPFSQRSWFARLWIRVSFTVIGLLFRCLCRLRIEGADHIPTHGGVVLASNHVSLFDTLLIPYVVMVLQGMQIVWAPAKEELFRNPLLRGILRSWGAFPVRRGRGDVPAMRRIMWHMRTEKVMLFPEGTRSRDGRLLAGKRSIGKLIYAVRPVVIPTALWGTNGIGIKKGLLPWCRPEVLVRFGKPLDLQPLFARPDTKETSEAIVRAIMHAIAALLPSSPAVPAPSTPAEQSRGTKDATACT